MEYSVLKVSANDRDSGVNGEIIYNIEPALNVKNDGKDFFKILTTGEIRVAKELDYETLDKTGDRSYFLNISASDNSDTTKLTTFLTVRIQIEDSDDLGPAFIAPGCTTIDDVCIDVKYTITLESGVKLSNLNVRPSAIKAIDRDKGINNPISYSFVAGEPSIYNDFFEISSDGIVTQKKAVDRITDFREATITILAQEISIGKRFETALLQIIINQKNDFPPIIKNVDDKTTAFIKENSDTGSFFVDDRGKPFKIEVTDPDQVAGDVETQFSIDVGNTGLVGINSDGYLILQQNVDRERLPDVIPFTITARELNVPNNRRTIQDFNLKIIDVNDNAPKFSSTESIVFINERLEKDPLPVVTVSATDEDSGEFGNITYKLESGGRGKFRVESSNGTIFLIDSVQRNEEYVVFVKAQDNGPVATRL